MEKHIQDIIDELQNSIIVIEKFADSKKNYTKAIDKYYDYIKQGFEHVELRTCPVHFRFFDDSESYIHTLQLRHFLTNLLMWQPLVALGYYKDINETFIIDCTQISTDLIENFLNDKIVIPYRKEVKNVKMNKTLHDTIFSLSRISTDFNILLGLSINTETFIDVSRKNKRFDEIIRTKLDENMQPNEIEETLDKLMKEQIEILQTEDNFLRPILRSGTGIKHKQLSEFAINGGLKPELDGSTIPVPINSNFIVGGLNNSVYYYIDSLGGRKAAVMNKTVMGLSGHFSRMNMLLATGSRLSKTIKNCGTVHPVEINISNKKQLQKLGGRYYRLPHERQYKVLDNKDKSLIGKTILMRSPVTCASDEICHMCYGDLYYANRDIESIGGLAGAKITEPLSQSILSSKHLLTTQSEKVDFNPEFDKFFILNANEIVINPDLSSEGLSNYSLLIIKKNIITIDDVDVSHDGEDEDFEFNKYTIIFHIKDKKTGEIIDMIEAGRKELYLTPELMDIVKDGKKKGDVIEVDLDQFNIDERIFSVEISNNELTKPLYNIMYLLDNEERRKEANVHTINDMVQRMLDLLIESKIGSDLVHGELLIRPLIRSQEDILALPDFKRYDAINNYRIMTVKSALEKNPSVLISLSFQYLKRQLSNPLTFRKTKGSYIDPFFKLNPSKKK